MLNHNEQLDRVFHALADATRRDLLERLVRGPASVKQLAGPLAMTLPAVMQHLHVLEACGLVRSQKTGRVRTCQIEPAALRMAEDWIGRQRTAWEHRLDRLGGYLAEHSDPPKENAVTERSVIHSTFSLERRYEVSPARVFAAWADPGAKARWFSGPDGEHKLDFRIGGREVNRGRRDGKVLTFESRYADIVPDQRIVYTSTLHAGDTLATVSLTTVELFAEDHGTRLLLTEDGAFLDGLEQPDWREQGTRDWLGSLDAELRR